ncbi:MAG: hypothetical protein K1X86_00025 [Ignavibacteria bacterium]|nr:hypothetical protein [Ignavibacteria bacterium]
MVKGKIIDYISSISKDEFENLEDFLRSPVFSRSLTAIKFYAFLKKNFKEKKRFEFTWVEISEYVYGGEKYNENRVMKLVSDFCKILEKYFEFLIFTNDSRYRKNALLISLRKKELKKYFLKEYTETDLRSFSLNPDDVYYKYANMIEHSLLTKQRDDDSFEKTFNLIFIWIKLEHIINAAIQKQKGKIFYEKEIRKYLEENIKKIKKECPGIYYRYVVLKMLEERKPDIYYYEIKDFLKKNETRLDIDSQKYFYDKFLYFCGINRKRKDLNKDEFLINRKLEAKGVFKDKKFGYAEFINIIESALRQSELNWSGKFIKEYGDNINEFKQETLAAANALLELHKGNNNEALKFANQIRNKNAYFNLIYKRTLEKIF